MVAGISLREDTKDGEIKSESLNTQKKRCLSQFTKLKDRIMYMQHREEGVACRGGVCTTRKTVDFHPEAELKLRSMRAWLPRILSTDPHSAARNRVLSTKQSDSYETMRLCTITSTSHSCVERDTVSDPQPISNLDRCFGPRPRG